MKVPGPASFPVIGSKWYLLRHPRRAVSRMVQVLHPKVVRRPRQHCPTLSAPAQEAVIIFDPEVYMDVHPTVRVARVLGVQPMLSGPSKYLIVANRQGAPVDGPRHYAVANHASTYPNPAPRIVFEPR